MSSLQPPGGTRRHDLDALRAIAMLLGLVLHAMISFLPGDGFWAVSDSQSRAYFGVILDAIHGFRMPLFFFLSGYFTMMLYRRRGLRSLLEHRTRRILLPLLVAWMTVVPAMRLVSAWARSDAAAQRRINRDGGEPANATSTRGASTEPASKSIDPADVDIWMAAALGKKRWVIDRLESGVPVDAREPNRESTPLLMACLFGRYQVAQTLIERGADPTAANLDRATPVSILDLDWGTTQAIAGMIEVPVDKAAVLGGRKKIRQSLPKDLVNSDNAPPGYIKLYYLLTYANFFDHLWFLNFLCWLVAGFALAVAMVRLFRVRQWSLLRTVFGTAAIYAVVVPATFVTIALMAPGGFGPNTSVGLLPMPSVLVYYAVFYFAGVLFFDADGGARSRSRLGRWWWGLIAAGLLIAFPLGREQTSWWDDRSARWLAQSIYAWLMTVGCMGMFRRWASAENHTMRYLSDASYWVYLIHLPLVIGFQHVVRNWQLPPELKCLGVIAVVTLIAMLSYQWLVRYTFIGAMLNGRKHRPAATVRGGEASVAT